MGSNLAVDGRAKRAGFCFGWFFEVRLADDRATLINLESNRKSRISMVKIVIMPKKTIAIERSLLPFSGRATSIAVESTPANPPKVRKSMIKPIIKIGLVTLIGAPTTGEERPAVRFAPH